VSPAAALADRHEPVDVPDTDDGRSWHLGPGAAGTGAAVKSSTLGLVSWQVGRPDGTGRAPSRPSMQAWL
jgi:hypothetical protein